MTMTKNLRVLVLNPCDDVSQVAMALAGKFEITLAGNLDEARQKIREITPFAVVFPYDMADEFGRQNHSDTLFIALISYSQPDLFRQWNYLDESHYLFPLEDIHDLSGLLHHLARQKRHGLKRFAKMVEHNRRLGTAIHRWTSFIGANVIAGLFWGSFVRLCFRWQVDGLEHLESAKKQGKSILIAANHPRETDAPLYAYRLLWPAIGPDNQPSLLAGGRIYAQNRFLRFFSYIYKFYLVDHGMGPLQSAVLKFINDMHKRPGLFIVYPEGPPRDEPHEELRSPKPGIGLIAYHSNAIVLPMVTEGVSRVFPKSFTWPRPFQSLRISIGPPVDLSKHLSLPGTRETIDDLTQHIFTEIVSLKNGLNTANESEPLGESNAV